MAHSQMIPGDEVLRTGIHSQFLHANYFKHSVWQRITQCNIFQTSIGSVHDEEIVSRVIRITVRTQCRICNFIYIASNQINTL